MALARELQQRYYNTTASLPGYDIACAAYPADETGGDYFDFLPQPDDSLYIVIADISGHDREISEALRRIEDSVPGTAAGLECAGPVHDR